MPEINLDHLSHTLPYKPKTYLSYVIYERFFNEFIIPSLKELGNAFNNHAPSMFKTYMQATNALAHERGTNDDANMDPRGSKMKILVS